MENKLPEGWEWKKLGEIGELISGVTYKSNEALDKPKETYTPILRANNINVEVNFQYLVYVPTSCVKDKQLIRENDILIAMSSGSKNIVGKTAQAKTDYFGSFGAFCALFRCKKGTNKKYVGYYFKTSWYRNKISSLSRGANINNLRKENITSLDIPIPPLETQQKIVSILEKAEETKKLRAQADELTQKLLQSVFLEMFGDPVANPNNWKEIKLKDVSEIVSGVTKGRKLTGKNTVFVPYLRVANVQDGYLDLTEIKDIEVLPSDVEKYALQDGDILLTEGGDPDKLGRGTVWNKQIPTCIHQNHIFRVRVNKEFLVPEYLSMLIGSAYGKMYFLKSAKQTTGIASINSTQLKNFPALIAPLDLQLKFAEIVHQVEKTSESQNQSSFEINNLFDALMQKAFTGELVS